MHGAAGLRKKERLSPSPCMHTASIWGGGKFCLDREFSKNAPYKQKIIIHLASNDKMEQKNLFFAWTVDQWYKFDNEKLEITSFKSCEQSNLCSIFKERIPQVGDVALNLSLPLKIQLLAIWSPFNQY